MPNSIGEQNHVITNLKDYPMTRRLSLITLATLVFVAAAQAQDTGRGPADIPERYLDPESQLFDIGDFVSPIQQILHNVDHAAYELWLIFIVNGSYIDDSTISLHRQVRDQVADREKLLLLLRYAEVLNNVTMHRDDPHLGSPSHVENAKAFEGKAPKVTFTDHNNATPAFFRDRSNLEMLRKRAKFTKQLHRKVCALFDRSLAATVGPRASRLGRVHARPCADFVAAPRYANRRALAA